MCEYCGCRRFPEIGRLGAEHDQIQEIADRVEAMSDAELSRVRDEIENLRGALEPHVEREEAGIFNEARARGIARNYWIEDLEEDHRRFARILADPTNLTKVELVEFLQDLHRHISVEEYDLFPAMARIWEADPVVVPSDRP